MSAGQNQISPEAMKTVQSILYFWSLALIAAGVFFLIKPDFLEQHLKLDGFINTVTAVVLIVLGVGDFLIARFFFNGEKRL